MDNNQNNIERFLKEKYEVYRLSSQCHNGEMSIELVPSIGSNVIRVSQRIVEKEFEIIESPPSLQELESQPFNWGIPVCSFANRWSKKFFFNNIEYETPYFDTDHRGIPLHGFLYNQKWEVVSYGEERGSVWIETSFNTKDLPDLFQEVFGFLQYNIIYYLDHNRLTIKTKIQNQCNKERIVSIALHPWFKVYGNRDEAYIDMPARSRLVLDSDMVPIKKLSNTILDGTCQIGEATYDDDFTDFIMDRDRKTTIGIIYPDQLVELSVRFSEEFRHCIFFAPDKEFADKHHQGNRVFACEPQSSSIGANSTIKKLGNPVILQPGETFSGDVTINLRPSLYNIDHCLSDLMSPGSCIYKELTMTYGNEFLKQKDRLISVLKKFKENYQATKWIQIARAPGRITANDHLGYNHGTLIGMPIKEDTIAIVGRNNDYKLNFANTNDKFHKKSYELSKIENYKIPKANKKDALDWSEFGIALFKALLQRVTKRMPFDELCGIDLLIDGGVPIESNMSSSAAFEMALAIGAESVWSTPYQLSLGEIVYAGVKSEHSIGFNCDHLDQTSSIINRKAGLYGEYIGAKIGFIPMIDSEGREIIKAETFPLPEELEAILVYTGPKSDATIHFNIRVAEGELGSFILTKNLYKLSKSFETSEGKEKIRTKINYHYPCLDPNAGGNPSLYDKDRLYPPYLKPAWFSRPFLEKIGINLQTDEIVEWIKDCLPEEASKYELINTYCLDKDFYTQITDKAGINSEDIKYNLQGTVLHAVLGEERSLGIVNALKDIHDASNDKKKEKALLNFGKFQLEEYESLKNYYRNSTKNIDNLIDWAKTKTAWFLGGRHFGAGWGGWIEIWIKPGRIKIAKNEICNFLKSQEWYQEIAQNKNVGDLLDKGIKYFRPGFKAGLVGFSKWFDR